MSTTLIAIFPSRQAVIEALDHLSTIELVEVDKAAVVAKAATGETIIVNNKIQPIEGRKAGGSLGALMTALGVAHFGALAFPGIGPILALGAGAIVGGLVGGATGQFAATLLNAGFIKEEVDTLANRLKHNEAALILELEERDSLPQLRYELSKLNVEVFENLDPVIS